MKEDEKNLEEKLKKITDQKIESDKRIYRLAIVIGLFATIWLLVSLLVGVYIIYTFSAYIVSIILFAVGLIMFVVAIVCDLKIEHNVGYYQCAKCHKTHVASYSKIIWAPHSGWTRYMKCPHCNQKSWNQKVLSEKE